MAYGTIEISSEAYNQLRFIAGEMLHSPSEEPRSNDQAIEWSANITSRLLSVLKTGDSALVERRSDGKIYVAPIKKKT